MKTKDCCKVEKQDSLMPLYVLLSGIFIVSIALSYIFVSNTFMMYLMGVWFLSFGVLKLIDISSFAKSYAQYDLIAKIWHGYGYIYPFIEIVLGLVYILNTRMQYMTEINIIALIIALLGIVSAYRVIASGQSVTCACMGTYWKLPMSRVTIMENGVMLLMVIYMLIYPASMMSMSMDDMMTPTSSDDTAMRDHCRMMPAMAGCERFR